MTVEFLTFQEAAQAGFHVSRKVISKNGRDYCIVKYPGVARKLFCQGEWFTADYVPEVTSLVQIKGFNGTNLKEFKLGMDSEGKIYISKF